MNQIRCPMAPSERIYSCLCKNIFLSMAQFSNVRLQARMVAALVLLLLMMVATALVSGSVLTILFTILYLFTAFAVPSMQLILVVLGCSAAVVLAFVAWGERHAPDILSCHAVRRKSNRRSIRSCWLSFGRFRNRQIRRFQRFSSHRRRRHFR